MIHRESSPSTVEAQSRPSHGEELGRQIGRYKLLQLIGEGGFGSVFMAEQDETSRLQGGPEGH